MNKKKELSKDELARYINYHKKIGKIDTAINMLKKQYQRSQNTRTLEQIIQLQLANGELHMAGANLDTLIARGVITEPVIMQRARLFYQQGDYIHALRVLNKLPQSKQTVPYWQVKAEIAWTLNKYSSAQSALLSLARHNKASALDYTRLAYIFVDSSPKRAAYYAKRAFTLQPNGSTFLYTLNLAWQQRDLPYLDELLHKTSPTIIRLAQTNPYYWEIRAEYAVAIHAPAQAFRDYTKAIQLFPHNINLKMSMLYFLMAQKNANQVGQYLSRWQTQIQDQPGYPALMRGYYQLTDNRYAALYWWDKERIYAKNNPIWWFDYSQALIAMGYHGEASIIQRGLWTWLTAHPWHQDKLKTQLYGQLAFSQAEGDDRWEAALINYDKKTNLANDILLTTALSQTNFSLAHYISNDIYTQKDKIPKWAELTIALQDQNREKMAQLLFHHQNKLAIRDRVQAAMALGDYVLAKKLAYDGLKRDPHDAFLYQQLVEIMVEDANYFSIGTVYRSETNNGGPEVETESRTHLLNHIYLVTQGRYWYLANTDNSTIRNAPTLMVHSLVGIHMTHHQGFNELDLLVNSAWKHFYGARFETEYNLTHGTILTVTANYHEISEENFPLRVAGMQNSLNISVNQTFSPADSALITARAAAIYSQSNEFLSHAYFLEAAFTHRLFWADGNVGLTPFTAAYYYDPINSLPSDLTQFVPTTDTPTIGFFIPQNFYQYGMRITWNDDWRHRYRERWRPFASVTALNNSLNGFGYSYEVGLIGSVFGRDALRVYLSKSTNTQDQNQENFIAGLNYTIYLTR